MLEFMMIGWNVGYPIWIYFWKNYKQRFCIWKYNCDLVEFEIIRLR